MPIYRFRCEKGHDWEEYRELAEETKGSANPCEACMEAIGGPWVGGANPLRYGTKIPAQVSPPNLGRSATPTFFPNRDHK